MAIDRELCHRRARPEQPHRKYCAEGTPSPQLARLASGVDQAELTEVVGFSERHAATAQDVVGGDDVEVEVRDLATEQVFFGLPERCTNPMPAVSHDLGQNPQRISRTPS